MELNTRVRSNFTARQETRKIDSRIMSRSWKNIPVKESDFLSVPLKLLVIGFFWFGGSGSGSGE